MPSILSQIEKCAAAAPLIRMELILFNDYPEEVLEVSAAEFDFAVCVINNTQNRGIHGARVEALKYSRGEYVVFFDQDDRLEPLYVYSQMQSIGSADAVVCRAIHDKRLLYTDSHKFEDVISKHFMFNSRNPIVSPGQVVIRKEAIPEMWKENILHTNGADDYFLWLLMAGTGKGFALNQEVLFEHIVDGGNTSLNTNQMMDSEQEMVEILLKSHIFSQEDEAALTKIAQSLRRMHIAQLDNYKMAYGIMNTWLRTVQSGKSPTELLERQNIKKIAIYGAGDVGKCLYMLLSNTKIAVPFYIDQNAAYIQAEVPVYTLDESPLEVDAIIISVFSAGAAIEELIKRRYQIPVYQISVFLDMENG